MHKRRLRAAACIALMLVGATAVALASAQPPFPLAAAQGLFDALAFRYLGPLRAPNPDVIVVGITEETLAALPYRSPVDRLFLADLIDTLARKGVAAIGLDILLDRPTEPAKDAALHRALTRHDIPVVAISIAPDTLMPADRRAVLDGFLEGVRSGDANLARDRFDDVVRNHMPLHPVTGSPSFPAAVAGALGAPVPVRPFPIEWRRSTRGAHTGPDVPTYPAESIALLPAGWLKGKVALIGSLISGSDEHRTIASTFGPPSFGVEIHAQVVAQLLDRRAEPEAAMPRAAVLATAGLAAAGVTLGVVVTGYLFATALAAFGILFVTAVLAAYAYTGVLVPVAAPLLALVIAGGAGRGWRSAAERRDRKALRALFSRFVSEPVVNEIMKDRDLFMAGGRPVPRQLTATVLYADVAGFTTICEGMEPAPLIAWLDRYIDTMAALIMGHDGVLLRFVGDGILAVFGVPVPRLDEAAITADAQNAARCALAMEAGMQRLNDSWSAEGLPVGGLRVGLHTGPMVAGSLGKGARMEFCLLGDTANVGQRLEQLGKEYAEPGPRYCTIVVGESTWLRLGGLCPGIPLGNFALRGRHGTIAAYRIDSATARSAGAATAQPATGLQARSCPESLLNRY
nr:adenylate/guanylate cyclase domain-containing protein [uncultured Rhodopila sp.]